MIKKISSFIICLLIIPAACTLCIHSFIIYPYMNEIVKENYSYYREEIYKIIAQYSIEDYTPEKMLQKIKSGLWSFCDSKKYPSDVIERFNNFSYSIVALISVLTSLFCIIVMYWNFSKEKNITYGEKK